MTAHVSSGNAITTNPLSSSSSSSLPQCPYTAAVALRQHMEEPCSLAAHLLLVLSLSEKRFAMLSEQHMALQATVTLLQSQVSQCAHCIIPFINHI
jgi:hypothetical protein